MNSCNYDQSTKKLTMVCPNGDVIEMKDENIRVIKDNTIDFLRSKGFEYVISTIKRCPSYFTRNDTFEMPDGKIQVEIKIVEVKKGDFYLLIDNDCKCTFNKDELELIDTIVKHVNENMRLKQELKQLEQKHDNLRLQHKLNKQQD